MSNLAEAMEANNKTISQASVVPYRFSEAGLELCLITTRRSGRWGFPKGTVSNGDSAETTALDEALEEAGLSGQIVGRPVGEYSYKKDGRKRFVVVMLMCVDSCGDKWKEAHERERRWATPDDARNLIDRANLLEVLDDAVAQIQKNLSAADGAA